VQNVDRPKIDFDRLAERQVDFAALHDDIVLSVGVLGMQTERILG
jgi:hypothetical protein